MTHLRRARMCAKAAARRPGYLLMGAAGTAAFQPTTTRRDRPHEHAKQTRRIGTVTARDDHRTRARHGRPHSPGPQRPRGATHPRRPGAEAQLDPGQMSRDIATATGVSGTLHSEAERLPTTGDAHNTPVSTTAAHHHRRHAQPQQTRAGGQENHQDVVLVHPDSSRRGKPFCVRVFALASFDAGRAVSCR
jgi:hypothetical protein